MKFTKIFCVLMIYLFSNSCSNSSEEVAKNEKAKLDTLSETTDVVFNFLHWYKNNYLHLQDSLVLGVVWENEKWDSTKYYRVNFPATEKYLETLKSTGYISDTYIEERRKYFQQCEEGFIKTPANDGPPEGFDYDLILFSQEDPGINELHKCRVIRNSRHENKCEVFIEFPFEVQYVYELSFHNGKWLIDNIKPHYNN
ncbi:MAG: hypothetical protein KF900_02455 [Bacteroidetes bacterium]|nr:hypothetical protein [Bacteroidota bacterium]